MRLRTAALILIVTASIGGCSRPRPPLISEVAVCDTTGWAHDVIVEHDRVFVADRQGGYVVFDRGQSWASPVVHAPVSDVISLAPDGSRPLLASRFEGLVEVSGTGQVLARLSNGDIANAVAVRDDLAFVAYGLHGLVVARVAPERLTEIAGLASPGWAHDVKLRGDYAYVADWNNGLRVIDIRNPARPVEAGVVATQATCISVAFGDPSRGLLAVAEGHAGVSVISVDAGGRPSRIGHNALGLNPGDIPHPEIGGWAHGAAWAGPFIFVANWRAGLFVLDAHDPARPKVLLRHPTPGTSLAVAAEAQPDGSYTVFLADGESGLRILRFTS
jgi:hypothetical protein